jgi:hypothetical protein
MKSRTIKEMAFATSLFMVSGSGAAQMTTSLPKLESNVTSDISIRTERYPRLPYSSATYYIYERGGKDICTKLEVCDKFDSCESKYVLGSYKSQEDVKEGKPYGVTSAALIPKEKLSEHVCLTKFSLINAK